MEKFLLGVLAGITGLTLTALIAEKLEDVDCEKFLNSSKSEKTETEPEDDETEPAGSESGA